MQKDVTKIEHSFTIKTLNKLEKEPPQPDKRDQ